MAKLTDNNATEEIARALDAQGVDTSQVAAFLSNLVGGKPMAGEENVPGYDYLARVGAAGYRALQAQTEAMNGAWSEIKRGRYGFGSALRLFGRTVENYYGIFVEATKGPGYVHRPAWLVFPFSRANPATLDRAAQLDCTVDKSLLDYTLFEAFGQAALVAGGLAGAAGAAGAGVLEIYATPPTAEGSIVEVHLNPAKVAALPNGDYVSFIFPRGKGADAPLVVVVLRVGA